MPDLALQFRKMNERQVNPNHYITFITVLEKKRNAAQAMSIMRALAAQVKKVMEPRKLVVNSFEEAKWNPVWAGRNWNHGQTIQLVLRRPNGDFYPMSWLVSVLCHELSHNKHMNHGKGFQAMMAELKADVRSMQARGYYGDGFFSAGFRLLDGSPDTVSSLMVTDLPEYACDGAYTQADSRRRGTVLTRRLGMVNGEASHLSGRQTARNRKAGGRATWEAEGGATLEADGLTIDGQVATPTQIDDIKKRYNAEVRRLQKEKQPAASARRILSAEEWAVYNSTTRGKSAKTKSAKEKHADALERRLGLKKTPEPDHTEEDRAAARLARFEARRAQADLLSSSESEAEGDGLRTWLRKADPGDPAMMDDPLAELPEEERDYLRTSLDDLTDMAIPTDDDNPGVHPVSGPSKVTKRPAAPASTPTPDDIKPITSDFDQALARMHRNISEGGDIKPKPKARNAAAFGGTGYSLSASTTDPAAAPSGPSSAKRRAIGQTSPARSATGPAGLDYKSTGAKKVPAERKQGDGIGLSPQRLAWDCARCTQRNPAGTAFCDACGQQRHPNPHPEVIEVE